jgi:6-pyruvoyltetrahydropterin/6-carboxytetrahydropterin synthase
MFDISIKEEFSSAHNLRGYKGKCEALHGHNWQVEVVVSSKELDEIGMAIDFKRLKEIVNCAIKELDHKYLNELPYFSAVGGSASGGKKVNPVRKKVVKDKYRFSNGVNPTSENIAKYIFDKINLLIKKESVVLKSVSIWESQDSKATYSK